MVSKNVRIFLIAVSIILFLLIITAGIYQFITVSRAHETFENYYSFRGCAELINRTSEYGYCKTNSGETIKIVEYNHKWYLDGDLPWAP